jgi:threonine/homoserine/homoserine lactone efflux protein
MENIIALVAATVVLLLIPGPNVALIVANSLRYGLKTGLVTAFGTTLGLGLQLLFVVGGLAALVDAAASALTWIRWIGVAYLLYLGLRSWHETPDDLSRITAQSHARIYWRSVLLAAVNPKTFLFNAAFLPQFVVPGEEAAAQLLVLGAVFLSVIVVGDALWAVFASAARRWLGRFGRFRNKLTGGFLFGAGVGLALSK